MANKVIGMAAVLAASLAGSCCGWAGEGLDSLKVSAGERAAALEVPAVPAARAEQAPGSPTGRFLVPAAGGLTALPVYIYTAVFPAAEEAERAMRTMAEALSAQGMLVTGRRVTATPAGFLVQVEYAAQQTVNAYRYTSRPYATRYEAAQSMDEARDELKKGGMTVLSYNVYATQDEPKAYYFAIGLLKNSRIDIKEYADTDYADRSIAWRCMDETVTALRKAGVPVLSYAVEKTDGGYGFRVDLFKAELRDIMSYTSSGFSSAFEARAAMQEGIDALAASGATILGNHVENGPGGVRIHVSFIAGSLQKMSEYASPAFKDRSEARRSMDEALTNLRKAGIPVISYSYGEGNGFRVLFLSGQQNRTTSYASEEYASAYEARQSMYEAMDNLAPTGAAVLSYRVEPSVSGFRFVLEYVAANVLY